MNHGPQASVVVSVEVTSRDIELGKAGNCEHCPVARALERAVGCGVSIDTEIIVFYGTSVMRRFTMYTPKEFAVFITRFDDLGAEFVEPFTLDLSVPAWIVADAEAA